MDVIKECLNGSTFVYVDYEYESYDFDKNRVLSEKIYRKSIKLVETQKDTDPKENVIWSSKEQKLLTLLRSYMLSMNSNKIDLNEYGALSEGILKTYTISRNLKGHRHRKIFI